MLSQRAHLRAAAAACAVETFRLEQKRWPKGWEDIVPGYLEAIPLDPYTQKPLIWKALPDGMVIYSVGPNGLDEEGAVLEKMNGQAQDIGVRLWVEESRGRAK